jgi:signal transduction histidine kinase
LSQQRNAHDYRRSLGVVQDEAGRLSRIVDDMLALARADAGHPLRKQELYLDDLLQEACKAAQVLAARQGVALKLEVAEDVSLQGDEDLLRRLILNLLDNAIKHTPEGGSVAVSLAVTGSWVRIVVSDTGAGIPEEAIPHVFERFYRVDKTRSRADGGSGLGLSIAKCVAEAHAGSIDLVSHPGQGSTFTVSLPRSTG